jgi:hypothetical protein
MKELEVMSTFHEEYFKTMMRDWDKERKALMDEANDSYDKYRKTKSENIKLKRQIKNLLKRFESK